MRPSGNQLMDSELCWPNTLIKVTLIQDFPTLFFFHQTTFPAWAPDTPVIAFTNITSNSLKYSAKLVAHSVNDTAVPYSKLMFCNRTKDRFWSPNCHCHAVHKIFRRSKSSKP
jgi:hypothetical protein